MLDIDPKSECRIVFNEINKEAVKEAIKHPRSIDMGLVDAQQARRVLDRLVGYQISPLLWQKVRRGLSAGRVQSAALKMICDRENEIKSFVPEEYWTITADYGDNFNASLSKYNGEDIRITKAEEADAIEKQLSAGRFVVESVKTGKRKPKPYAPFTTSSLQQDASIKLNFQTKKTMQIAQQLYEGIEVKGIGTRGLITYLRTDSVRISSAAKEAADGAPRQLDMKIWQSFQTRLKERNRLAASLLSGAAYEGMTETHFFIRPSSDMARDYIKKRHRAVFDEVMTELAGRPLAVVCTGGEEEELPPPPPPKEPDYPAPVAALLEVAGEGARVEEVTAPPRAAQKKPATPPQESAAEENDYEPYEPTPDEEAEMFDDELPPDA